jgi:hypothetical protein
MNEKHKAADAAYRAKAEAARNAPIAGYPVRLRLPGEREPVDGLRIMMQGRPCYLVVPTPDRFVDRIFRPEEVEVLAREDGDAGAAE